MTGAGACRTSWLRAAVRAGRVRSSMMSSSAGRPARPGRRVRRPSGRARPETSRPGARLVGRARRAAARLGRTLLRRSPGCRPTAARGARRRAVAGVDASLCGRRRGSQRPGRRRGRRRAALGRRRSGSSRPSPARDGRSDGSMRWPAWWHDGSPGEGLSAQRTGSSTSCGAAADAMSLHAGPHRRRLRQAVKPSRRVGRRALSRRALPAAGRAS